MNLIKPFVAITLLFITLGANALNLGQILGGAGSVGKAWNEEEQRQLENQKLQLEVEKLNREAEIERYKFQKKLQNLRQNEAVQNQDLQSFQQELSTKLPMVIDKDTILVSTIIESQNIFKFVYKLPNLQRAMVNTTDFWNQTQPKLNKSTCTNDYWGAFVRSGGAVLYHYLDQDSNHFSTIIISSCNN